MNDRPPQLEAAIRAAGQADVLRFWDRLDAAARDRFRLQLEAIDWASLPRLGALARGLRSGEPRPAIDCDLSSARTPPCESLDGSAEAESIGRAALAEGSFGAILVAGGQGSRLGCDGPKGAVSVGPITGATLFELLLGKLHGVERRYGRPVPLAIMTSSSTDRDTRAWLATHDHCGLDPERVLVFRQGDLPALDDREGNLLLDAPDRVAMAPDGHGGMLSALAAAGGLAWFAGHGCRHVVSFQVDNPLTMPLHPAFLGHHLRTGAEFTTQVVEKRSPGERVGVVVRSGDRTSVVEYSDLPAGPAAERLPDGRLRFHAGSIAVHAFTLEFLARSSVAAEALPLHLAHKAVPFVDDSGRRVTPSAPNAVKFERFIFDLMPLARRVTLVEIDPADGFAPLKNPPGHAADTLDHVRAALDSFARRLLARAGVDVADGVPVELAPWVAEPADIAAACAPGSRIARPTVIGAPWRAASAG